MKFQSRIRFEAGSTHRIIPPSETIRRMRPYMSRIGVTRIADTTGLDTISMPVFSAIRPADAGLDGISVYNGKGLKKQDALAGAMMEAVERTLAETWRHPADSGTYPEMRDSRPGVTVMDPTAMRLQQRKPLAAELCLEWADGWDLLADRPALIPMNFVLMPYYGPGKDVWIRSTSGLASGNCLEEAVCHGLAELIERDAYTIAVVRSELVAHFSWVVERVLSGQVIPPPAETMPFCRVDLGTLPPQVRRLVRSAQRRDAEVMLRDITSDIDIPAFAAMLRTRDEDGAHFMAGGLGCDPNAAIAAIRAITEAAQSRNVAIQGVREDTRAVKPVAPGRLQALWEPAGGNIAPFGDIPTYENDDIVDDVRLMIQRLRDAGITQAYAVDLSDQDIPASVARVVVPELESWVLSDFSPEECRLGRRAARYLRPHAPQVPRVA